MLARCRGTGVLAEHELAGDIGVGQSLREEFE